MNATLQLAELEQRFGIPAVAHVCRGNGGLPRVKISGSHGRGEMYLHGAHVTSWCPAAHDEILFLSTKARWQEGHAIRGGIPICFPWFRAKANDPQADMRTSFNERGTAALPASKSLAPVPWKAFVVNASDYTQNDPGRLVTMKDLPLLVLEMERLGNRLNGLLRVGRLNTMS